MPDPNHICRVCTDGKNSDEFALCPDCHEKLSNGWVGLKCSGCNEHKFLEKNTKTTYRVQKILDLWDTFARPGICSYKANEIIAAMKEDADKKAVIIYTPCCPKCYRSGAGQGYDPCHPLTIMKYKIACFSIEGLKVHSLTDALETEGIRILH